MGVTSATRTGCLVIILAVFGVVAVAAIWSTHNESPRRDATNREIATGTPSPGTAGEPKQSYTSAQLRELVASKNYPKEGESSTSTRQMAFGDCLTTTHSVLASMQPEYPVEIIADTSIVFMAKAWANDGAVLITCSGPDNQQVTLHLPYLPPDDP